MTSVIIPSARFEMLAKLVHELKQQERVTPDEIIVVTPKSRGIESLPESVITVATDRLYPPGRMRNLGAEAASGNVLIFIDDDCLPGTDFVEKLAVRFDSENKLGAVGCAVTGVPKSFWMQCADYCLFSSYQLSSQCETDLGSAALAVSRRAFQDTGGFDDELRASEDWDFSLRLRDKGWKCLFLPDLLVQHFHGRGSLAGILRQSWSSGTESGLAVQRRNYRLMSMPAKVAVSLGSPWVYWVMILPYAAIVAASQFLIAVKRDSRAFLYFPIMLLSRILYQIGVFRRIVLDSLS